MEEDCSVEATPIVPRSRFDEDMDTERLLSPRWGRRMRMLKLSGLGDPVRASGGNEFHLVMFFIVIYFSLSYKCL